MKEQKQELISFKKLTMWCTFEKCGCGRREQQSSEQLQPMLRASMKPILNLNIGELFKHKNISLCLSGNCACAYDSIFTGDHEFVLQQHIAKNIV